MRHTISVLVANKFGVLSRVSGLFSGRGFNIDSLNVAPTQDPSVSRITIQVPGDDRVLEQVTKQLNRLVDVIKVTDLTGGRYVDRELVLVRVAASPRKRAEINELAVMCGAKIAAVQQKSVILELTDGHGKVNDLLALLKPYAITEITRTGVIALAGANGNGKEKGEP